jgi:PKHD-type hydroxylase
MHANVLSNWNRQLTYGDTMQYAQYTEGQYYDWHTDRPPICNTPQHRKLTVVCLLNDPIEFEGGNLEIEINTTQATLQKGSVIVFPSVLRHRVTPVTKGIRKTATYWINGPATW